MQIYRHGPEHMSGIVRQPSWLSSGMLTGCLIISVSVVKPKTTGRPTATPHSRTTTGEGANFLGSQMAKHGKYYPPVLIPQWGRESNSVVTILEPWFLDGFGPYKTANLTQNGSKKSLQNQIHNPILFFRNCQEGAKVQLYKLAKKGENRQMIVFVKSRSSLNVCFWKKIVDFVVNTI